MSTKVGPGRPYPESEIITMISKRDLVLLHNFLLFYIGGEILSRLKKFATLLPNNWLVETPQPLALMWLVRQSAERERISSTNWKFFLKKL
ncbi:hypothetical protein [Peribacillus simplex]|uniref:hypothetical protein n=1 Tax=Peribacillus simplex TaxID=1478 RepID=UPI0011A05E98|nr:hypothetical protein [Peribacillus simplex]